MIADTVKKKLYNAGRVKERKDWYQVLVANPNKTADEIRRMVDKGELPTDA